MKKPIWFEDFPIGSRCKTKPYAVSREEIIGFASQWDPQPFHLDDEAARNSVFGKISACSAHIFALISRLSPELHEYEEPQIIAGLGFDKMRMLSPLFAGDTVVFQDEIILARPSNSSPENGIITSRGQLLNQHQRTISELEVTFLMKRRPV